MSEYQFEEELLSAFVKERMRSGPAGEETAIRAADEYMAWKKGMIAEVERAAAEKARRDLMLELLPVLEDAVSNVYLCQNDRGVGNEWDDEIKRAEEALERAEAYRQERGEQ